MGAKREPGKCIGVNRKLQERIQRKRNQQNKKSKLKKRL